MKKGMISVVLSVPLMFVGCYPDGPEYIEDFDLVITNHDTSFDFDSIETFALPNQVVKITGNLVEGDDPEFVSDEYADIILNGIRDNMEDYGWEEVDRNNEPDVIILPSAMQSTTAVWYYDYWYWDWWYPYYWWGWYYPYPIYGGSYTSGSLFVQMTYPAGITAADNIPVVWSSILNGLLEGTTENIEDRIERGIDQAFEQSPYLDQDED
jgi:hypothetical protein